jgi:hypothetical protein
MVVVVLQALVRKHQSRAPFAIVLLLSEQDGFDWLVLEKKDSLSHGRPKPARRTKSGSKARRYSHARNI